MFDFIARPLGKFLFFIYNNITFGNYGWAIILFTIIIKFALLPLTIKQLKSTARTQELQPQLQELQKRYKNDKEKLNQELMKFYQENNYNPAGGCLPLVVQLPILFSLFWVISRPLTYMLGKTKEQIELLKETAGIVSTAGYFEIDIINKLREQGTVLLDFEFLGLNLGMKPSYRMEHLFNNPASLQYWGLLLIPILAVVTTYLSSKMSMPKTGTGNNVAMQKNMMLIAPVMTLIFSFQFPAGLGVYWIAGYVFQIFQQLYINKHVMKKKEVSNN